MARKSVRGRVGSADQYGKLLKGSDVIAAGKNFISGVILEVREPASGFGSPFIVDFDTQVLPGISSWPCNVTEARRLASMIDDNPEVWEGYGLVLSVEMKNNPKSNTLVPGLVVYSVEKPATVAKMRKSKPTIKKGQNATAAGETQQHPPPF